MKVRDKTLNASEFKAKCLSILDNLGPEGLVITKHGRPVARVTPIRPEGNTRLIGAMKGKIRIRGNIFSTGVEWDAESRYSHAGRRRRRRPE